MKSPSHPPTTPAGRDKTIAREARLAAALRDNLRKRKAQARSRSEGPASAATKDQADGEDR